MIGGETQNGRAGVNPGGNPGSKPGSKDRRPGSGRSDSPHPFGASVRMFVERMNLREEANARAH